MKRQLYIIIIGVLSLVAACSEAEREMFHAPDAIYFRMPQGDTTLIIREDTIIYSFAFDPETITRREIYIPVELVGLAADRDREYLVEITNIDETREGVHYDALHAKQVFPAGKMRDSLRVTFLRTADMQQKAKKINITIRSGGDFAEGVVERLFVSIEVSDILVKPAWWDNWGEYFGPYDPQVYRAWINIWGGTGDLSAYPYPGWGYSPGVLTAIIDLRRYFEEHEVYYLDNPTVRIILPNLG
ncbi:MAG: DUF4843 domain-containing protein [Odoribacteraceae bacterium]|jgi:hypothetical protein|nr:DUF4843 domain-containing protein [Odoribacteraceae bacterium]